jgi:hypothetical protein
MYSRLHDSATYQEMVIFGQIQYSLQMSLAERRAASQGRLTYPDLRRGESNASRSFEISDQVFMRGLEQAAMQSPEQAV